MLAPRLLTLPSELSNTTCSSPCRECLWGEPTAMSGTPSRSTSPTPATARPNWLPAATPLTATSTDVLAVPSELSNTICAAPALFDRNGEPTTRSATPSPSTSPMLADDVPN